MALDIIENVNKQAGNRWDEMPFVGPTGEIINPETMSVEQIKLFRMTVMLGCIAQGGKIKQSVYIYNKNVNNHPKGPNYAVHPKDIYVRESQVGVLYIYEGSLEYNDSTQPNTSTTDNESENDSSEDQLSETSEPLEGWDDGEFLYAMSNDDRLDDSGSESDSEQILEMSQGNSPN